MSSSRHRVPLEAGLPIATISGEQRLVFASASDFDHAWDVGIFYLRIPENLDLDDARQFGRELISLDSAYRQIVQYGKLEGFIALENNQQFDTIGIAIIREVFNQSGIPEALWDRASGGYTSGGGDAFLNFVHYDTRNPDWGLRPHTDYGFITILDASAPGLQIEIDGQFRAVPILPDHLIINFGEALHFITAHSDRPVGAVVHRVLSQQSTDPIRHGIVYFANPDLDGILWQFDVRGEIKGSSSVEDLFALLEKNLIQNRK
jgi:hypothetical protein